MQTTWMRSRAACAGSPPARRSTGRKCATWSLSQHIAAVRLEVDQRKGGSPRKMTRSEIEYHAPRLEAALSTLQWLEANEAKIKEVLRP